MKRKVTSAVMVGSLVFSGGIAATSQVASASEANATYASADPSTTGINPETLTDLEFSSERLMAASAALQSQPGYGDFAYSVQMTATQHQMEIQMAWQQFESDLESGDVHAAKNNFENSYNRANADAMNSYHQAKDMFMDELNKSGAPGETKDELADAFNNTAAAMSAALEEIKAEFNEMFNEQLEMAHMG